MSNYEIAPRIKINTAQIKRLCAIQTSKGIKDSVIKDFLKRSYNIESRKDITIDIYDTICNWISCYQKRGVKCTN